MRTIKFRAKSILNDEWLYGDLVHSADNKRFAILVNDKDSYDECEVAPETVGQFTELKDKMVKKSLREIYWILMGLQSKYDLYEECLHY